LERLVPHVGFPAPLELKMLLLAFAVKSIVTVDPEPDVEIEVPPKTFRLFEVGTAVPVSSVN
jgi:hypothetical protein